MLKEYEKKRDFELTSEPPPEPPKTGEGRLIFVIQKHDATRLHYDFRLEVDGVLKSWPVPKGPSLDPADKRLAVMVEDHPLSYGGYEGVIPKGEYGAGQVIVWDAGTYCPDEKGVCFDDREEAERQMREGLKKGKLSFFLMGQKLKGSWTLVKITRAENEWLLIKHKDRFGDAERDLTLEDRSVISDLSIADLKAGRLPDRNRGRLIVGPADVANAKRSPFPKAMDPMRATLTEDAFSSPDWYFEPKMDGVRALAFVDGDKVRLMSRRGIDQTKAYPSVVDSLKSQTERMVLDGEIVALDERGVPSFQMIQQRLGLTRESDIRRMEEEIPVYYYVFDIPWAGGYDLRGGRLAERKALLRQLLLPDDCTLLLEHFEQNGEAAYEGAVASGLEGVIAKRRDSTYESGRRAKSWMKIKATREDDFVVGGFTGGLGGRAKTFGSLLVGQYDDAGRLVYAGNVGSGFNDKLLASMLKQLQALATDKSLFDVMEPGSARFGRPKDVPVTWVQPELVATVKFTEWTADNHLRAPSFVGLRTDKAAEDVRRETVAAPPPSARSKVPALSAGDDVAEVLEQLAQEKAQVTLEVGSEKVKVTNLDKVLWPAWERQRPLTKRDLLTYFARISPYLLPHTHARPLTLTRYPNGVAAGHFYQKHWEGKLPEFVETVTLWSEQNKADGEYLLCNNLPTLLWLGQIADIELHTWYSRVDPEPDGHKLPETYGGSEKRFERSRLNYPDFIVFDLDPYIYSGDEAKGEEPALNRKAFQKTVDVAFWLKELLDGLSLSSFVKTTGKTGLHIYVPIIRQLDYDTVRAAAETVGRFLVRAHPRDITMEWATAKRKGKIFFDHGQNTKGKTLASIYSPRPLPWAGVSMPVQWEELRDIYPSEFTILNAADRVAETDDLWAGILDAKHDVSAMLDIVAEAED